MALQTVSDTGETSRGSLRRFRRRSATLYMCVCVCSFFEDTNGRIIPVRKYLVAPPTGHLGNLEGEQPHLGDLFTMFINYQI